MSDLGENRKNNAEKNIKKVLSKVLKKIFKTEVFQINVEVNWDEPSMSIDIGQYENKILSAVIEQGEYGYQAPIIKDAFGSFGFFAQCVLDAFWRNFGEENYFLEARSEAERVAKIYRSSCHLLLDRMREEFGIDLDIVTKISSLYYESQPCGGCICFSLSSNKFVGVKLLKKEILFKEDCVRKIRKMLETTRESEKGQDNAALLANYNEEREWQIEGIADKEIEKADEIVISFISHMVWKMEGYGKTLIEYNNGTFEYPLVQERKLLEEKTRGWSLTEKDIDQLWKIVSCGKKQRHGTILVIFNHQNVSGISSEIHRLMEASTGNWINPDELSEAFLLRITAIDGAVIMDTKGKVYGFGVILDGLEGKTGDTSRGARFNCSQRYIASIFKREKLRLDAVAVIISEDGMVNFYSTDDCAEEYKQ